VAVGVQGYRHVEELGKQPVTAWSPDGRYTFVTHTGDTLVAVLDLETGRLTKRLEVGQDNANISFRPDGKYGYVTVTSEGTVAVVEMESLEVEPWLSVGQEPMGLILL
jgi:DNA-binding beta-propeller fold protein YncE